MGCHTLPQGSCTQLARSLSLTAAQGVRLLSVGYKTRLSDWGGYTLSLQDLSSHVLPRLLAAGVGSRPVVFVTHSLHQI